MAKNRVEEELLTCEELDQRKRRKRRRVITVITIIVIIIIILCMRCCGGGNTPGGPNKPWFDFADILPWDGDDQTVYVESSNEFTSIPGFNTIVVNEKQKEIQLYNPKENTVYFIYTITDMSGKELYKTDAIGPGNAVKWNVYNTVGLGTQTLFFKIACYDVETYKECPGIVLEVHTTVMNTK